jgi:hypothetical protein
MFGGDVDTGAADVDPTIGTDGAVPTVIAAEVEGLSLDLSAVCCTPTDP